MSDGIWGSWGIGQKKTPLGWSGAYDFINISILKTCLASYQQVKFLQYIAQNILFFAQNVVFSVFRRISQQVTSKLNYAHHGRYFI